MFSKEQGVTVLGSVLCSGLLFQGQKGPEDFDNANSGNRWPFSCPGTVDGLQSAKVCQSWQSSLSLWFICDPIPNHGLFAGLQLLADSLPDTIELWLVYGRHPINQKLGRSTECPFSSLLSGTFGHGLSNKKGIKAAKAAGKAKNVLGIILCKNIIHRYSRGEERQLGLRFITIDKYTISLYVDRFPLLRLSKLTFYFRGRQGIYDF